MIKKLIRVVTLWFTSRDRIRWGSSRMEILREGVCVILIAGIILMNSFLKTRLQLWRLNVNLSPCTASGVWQHYCWVSQRTNYCQERRVYGDRAVNNILVTVGRGAEQAQYCISTQQDPRSWNFYLGISSKRSLVFQQFRPHHFNSITNPVIWIGTWRTGTVRAAFPKALSVCVLLLLLHLWRDFPLASLEAGLYQHLPCLQHKSGQLDQLLNKHFCPPLFLPNGWSTSVSSQATLPGREDVKVEMIAQCKELAGPFQACRFPG